MIALALLALALARGDSLAARRADPGCGASPCAEAGRAGVSADRVPGWRGDGGESRRREPDPWFGPDKAKHFTMSAFIQTAAYAGLRGARVSHARSLAGASLVTAAFGVGKELRDRRQGRGFSVRDLLWDAAGAAAGGLLVSLTER